MRRIILIILLSVLSATAYARQAKSGIIGLTQPDGTTFAARMAGDEFMKIVTTAEGHAVIQGDDGWWCYAIYAEDGMKTSTGIRVGMPASSDILARSTHIPYQALAAASAVRKNIGNDRDPLLKRIAAAQGIDTKAGSDTGLKKHAIVILAQFADVKFTYTKEHFVNMLTKKGYSVNGATGCAKDYFDSQFEGRVDFEFTISDIVTLSRNRSYYGKNVQNIEGEDAAPAEMVVEACGLAAASGIYFDQFDDDNDDEVDNIFVFYAGGDEAEGAGSDCIWAHAWYVYDGAQINKQIDGKKINRYACSSELSREYISATKYKEHMAGIGTFCHEYSHTFGLPDLYDTDYSGSGGYSASMWTWTALMDGGNSNNNSNTPPYFNAIDREILGITEPVVIANDGIYTLPPIYKGRYFKINTDTEGEYFLIEYRDGTGWDTHIRGKGMLVYHIDKSNRGSGRSDRYGRSVKAVDRWGDYNEVNANPDYPGADLLEADGRKDVFMDMNAEYAAARENLGGIFFPYNRNNSLSQTTSPGLRFKSGAECPIVISDIAFNGENMKFKVTGFNSTTTPPNPVNLRTDVVTDAVYVTFESDVEYEGDAIVSYGKTGQETASMTVMPYTPGKWSVRIDDLESGNRTYTVTVRFEINGLAGDTASRSFMTSKTPPVEWPYIHMTKNGRNSDGGYAAGTSFPLHVVNSQKAAEVRWTFDGEAIKDGGSGYMILENSGSLKAEVFWKNGERDIIEKEISVK